MREEKELLESLCAPLLLVTDTIAGRVSIQKFIEMYGNFYYYEALDGHEADSGTKSLFQKYSHAISFHEMIQTQVVDITYLGPSAALEQYLAAGRITPEGALRRLIEIAETNDLQALIRSLCHT